MLSSDPHAWLRTFYARLLAKSSFPLLAPAHQFEQLLEAVAVDHPMEAKQMRQWSVGAQHALLMHLSDLQRQGRAAEEVELWRVQKDSRELTCVARYLPSGIDVRLLEGDGFRRTQLCRDAPEVEALSRKWREALTGRGWQAT